ncbi:MAG: Hydroxyacylglutathione hydrolase [Syntrophus sp. SKADARSKE-3]|nr:Hydroxyacylglutathione hydrolase [Syntrophus sp. SKADARSKE-3]
MSFIHQLADNLFLIDLDLDRRGFRQFISAWLYMRKESVFLVDPGPQSTYPMLQSALETAKIKHIDTVLLTHIHIDHAGCIGRLLRDYPQARLICHPRAFRFLMDPARLWEESRKVLGSLIDDYGPMEPVSENALSFAEKAVIGNTEIHAVETPGHAPHHLSFFIDDILFAGEMAGVHYPMASSFYLRPATPPVFWYDTFRSSFEKLSVLPARFLCFGHYGCRNDPQEILAKAAGQIELWLHCIRNILHLHNDESFLISVFDELLALDPLLADYPALPSDIREREWFFIRNSIRGMAAYLLDKQGKMS